MSLDTTRKTFSIIVPIYFNELNIPHLLPRLKKLQDALSGYTLEFIFVDDGSKDNSYEIIRDLASKDERVVALKLSRNFGSFNACLAGLNRISTTAVGR